MRLERDLAVAADDVVNVFHFEADDSGLPDVGNWADQAPGLVDRLVTFYEDIGQFLASTFSGAGVVTLYNHRTAPQRIPEFVTPFTFTPGSTSLPGEVALCLSYRAALEAGTFPARRRGRVYLGPMKVLGGIDGSDHRPDGTVMQDIMDSAVTMSRGSAGSARLCVYSPRTDPDGLDDECYNDVEEFYMDNAWDTQRRRGAAPFTRVITAI